MDIPPRFAFSTKSCMAISVNNSILTLVILSMASQDNNGSVGIWMGHVLEQDSLEQSQTLDKKV